MMISSHHWTLSNHPTMELQLVDKKQSPHIPRLQNKKVKVVIEQFWQVVHLQLAAYKNLSAPSWSGNEGVYRVRLHVLKVNSDKNSHLQQRNEYSMRTIYPTHGEYLCLRVGQFMSSRFSNEISQTSQVIGQALSCSGQLKHRILNVQTTLHMWAKTSEHQRGSKIVASKRKLV